MTSEMQPFPWSRQCVAFSLPSPLRWIFGTANQTRHIATATASTAAPTEVAPKRRGNKLAVIGLGNPGRQFNGTRHNVGFDVVSQLAAVHRVSFKRDRTLDAEVATLELYDREVRLVKPTTYMNASGRTVRKLKLQPNAILIVTDDMALDIGRIKLRPRGSAGGHNGLKSIEQSLGGREYPRLRIGVGSAGGPQHWREHVLGPFSKAERAEIEGVYIDCCNVVEAWIQHEDFKLATDLLSRLMGVRGRGAQRG